MNKTIKEKCTKCHKKATQQTVKGRENQRKGGLPINNGWYCDECYEIGVQIEKEAMF